MPLKRFDYSPSIFAVPDFLTRAQCRELIGRGESIGFQAAPIRGTAGEEMRADARSNARTVFDDVDLANQLWNRFAPFSPPDDGSWVASALNEKFRMYRYDQYQSFRRHSDGRFARSETEESRYTFMIYLNDDFEGGATDFDDHKVYPAEGMALCFHHPLSHEGAVVSRGVKYVLRSDVMFRNQRVPQPG